MKLVAASAVFVVVVDHQEASAFVEEATAG